jgi:hypothetical protein
MEFDGTTLEGTLKADGTIELDEKPNLPPGRVKILVQPVQSAQPAPPNETLLEFMQRSRRDLEAAGSYFMNEAEITAWIEQIRAEGDRLGQNKFGAAEVRRGMG